MQPQASLLRVVLAGAGFLLALIALIVLVLVTRNGGEPAPGLEPACLDFASQEEAQLFLDREGAQELDADGDGVACDALLASQAAPAVTLEDHVLTGNVTGTARTTPTATPTTTPIRTATPTTTPRSGILPKSGTAQSAQMAIAGMSLLTMGMFGVTVFNARSYVISRRKRREEETYDLIGW